ncbi:MAG: DUF1573 domain-containing protein [Bacteroidales bacterium]|nr:DUF1573 domain-containing protein [Bacteroidales bacterium]
MKKVLFFISLLIIGVNVNSQIAQTTIKFSETEHNFGTFKEEAGQQTFNFILSNTGTQPLVIQNVVASCGCTTPEWTKQPIPVGGKGKVTAIYDPRNRPGQFNKTLTVYTNTKPEATVLVIKGEVIPHEKTIEELFTYAVGGIRFESNHLAFTNIKKTEKKIRVMKLVNTSDSIIKVAFDGMPDYLTIKAVPEKLKPGEQGLVEGTIDATKNPNWGNVSSMLRVLLNGIPQENLYYYVSANLVEDFSSLSKAEIENSPVFKVASTTVDLGKIKGATQNDVEFKFANEGKRDLVIRYIRSSCGCTAVQQGNQGVGIKPGQSSSIKAVFNSGSYRGRVTKAIYVYTNDPKNSEVVLMLNADVEQQEVSK